MNIFNNCFELLSFTRQFAPLDQLWSMDILSTNISQGSVAMHFGLVTIG